MYVFLLIHDVVSDKYIQLSQQNIPMYAQTKHQQMHFHVQCIV